MPFLFLPAWPIGEKRRDTCDFFRYIVAFHYITPENEAEEYEEDFLLNMKNVIRAANRELITSDRCDYIIDSWRQIEQLKEKRQ